MGTYMHSIAEVKKDGKWQLIEEPIFGGSDPTSEPFGWQSYGLYGFLANIRNYSHSAYLSDFRGLPSDSEWLNSPSKYAYTTNPLSGKEIPIAEQQTNIEYIGGGSYGWLSLSELLAFDYDQVFEDRRISGQASPVDIGQGEMTTYRNFLSEHFFVDLEVLKLLGEPENVRIVFWFD